MNTKHGRTPKQPGSDSELLTVPEAAAFLRLRVSTLRAWVFRRQISYVKLGGKLVFLRRGDLQAFVDASVVPASEQRKQ